MKDFRELRVWEKSHALTLEVYRASVDFPKHEMFGLTSQLRRACVSVSSNIAEGCGRGTDREFAQFLRISMGSACEVEYQLLLARDLGYLTEAVHSECSNAVIEVKKMLTAFVQRLTES